MSRVVVLSATTDSPAVARTLVREEMSGCDDRSVVVAELIVSELVTNAVVHAETSIELEFERTDNTVRAAVTDEGTGRPTVRHPGIADEHGRGLLIVRSLADEWGVVERANGKSVWFTLTCD